MPHTLPGAAARYHAMRPCVDCQLSIASIDHPLIFSASSLVLWLLVPLCRCCFQYAQVVASENPDLIKCFVEKMPLPPHLEGNAIALQLVDYAQVQKKQWTVETGNQ